MHRDRTTVGIKLTHDGAVAILHGNKLRAIIEREKTANEPRHAPITELEMIPNYLAQFDLDKNSVDNWVVDGWFTQAVRDDSPETEFHCDPFLKVQSRGMDAEIAVAAYREHDDLGVLEGRTCDVELPGLAGRYRSQFHTTGHLASGYCTSPWSKRKLITLVLVWDGGVSPRAYVVDPQRLRVTALGPILPLKGSIYALVAQRFQPFVPAAGTDQKQLARYELEVPGKAMAYAGLGRADREFYEYIRHSTAKLSSQETFADLPRALASAIAEGARVRGMTSADALCTWQRFVGDLLEQAVARLLAESGLGIIPVVLTGGCALNIGWNSRLRDSELLGPIWVPPFPNDSGSALGAACAEIMRQDTDWAIDWDVYSGPALLAEPIPAGWTKSQVGTATIAKMLHDGAIVMILEGRAELGPRALGHRSIVAAATSAATRDKLNDIKRRERYRPVAPVCLEERASEIFDPGGCDPFMLFQHEVRDAWRHKIPAVTHTDGTARLQTVRRDQDRLIYELLQDYASISGIPVLCNTSANLPGRGFFPSLAAALNWGGVDYVWSGGFLFHRTSAGG